MTEPARRPDAPDPTFYPEEEQVPETQLHREIGVVAEHLVRRWLAERRVRACVCGDMFVYWVEHRPTTTVAPDVFVLPGVDADATPRSWKTWETGVVPSFALEVVGLDVRKDYEVAPSRYEELGVKELVVYDPERTQSPERVCFQVWRRRRGKLVLAERTDRDRVRSTVLRCFLREVGEGSKRRLRLATGELGDTLVLTAEEAERDARAALDAERARRETAESELVRLRDELEKLRGR